jgi:glycerophosphoryl diester phosphodiesterase
MNTTPIAIAHRGDPVTERENTLAAFAAAVRKGADMVELDLRRTRDGEIVVLHDASLARLWAVDQAVADLDLAELKQVGRGAMRVPTLGEVLDAIDVPLMVDFTGDEVVEGAVTKVREAGAISRSLFVTGNVGALRVLRAFAPEARIGLTWIEPEPPPLSVLQELGAEFWNPAFGLITRARVDAMHAVGFKVSTWTVDQLGDMASVTGAGVDAVVSNRISDLRRFLSYP